MRLWVELNREERSAEIDRYVNLDIREGGTERELTYLEVCTIPSLDRSLALIKRGFHWGGRDELSTAKPWFWHEGGSVRE